MNSIFIKLTGNKDRHQILDGFEFRPNLTSHFGVTCPWAVKENDVSRFSQSPLIRYLSNLQLKRTGIKARKSSNLGRIGLLTSELFALESGFFHHRLTMEKMMYPLFLSYYEFNLHQIYQVPSIMQIQHNTAIALCLCVCSAWYSEHRWFGHF